jgi:hypothetical protein
MYHLRLSDAPQDLKDFTYQHSQVMQQQQAAAQETQAQGEQIGQAQAMNDLAQQRAEQEALPNQNPLNSMFTEQGITA